MSTVKIWLLAARPRTLIAGISPVLIGSVLSYHSHQFDHVIFAFTLFCSLGIQIGTNLANDYFDSMKGADTESRIGPVRATQKGLISPQAIKTGFIAVFFLTALCSLPLIAKGGMVIGVLASLSILLGILYTAGPYPIAYLGLGEFFVLFFYGPIATAGTAYLQTGVFSLESALVGIAPGALSCCILIVNNLRDVEQDRIAAKKTLIVRFGKRFGEWEYALFLGAALLIPLYYWNSHRTVCLTTLLLLFPSTFMIISLFKVREAVSYIPFFKRTAMTLVLYTLVFCLAWFI